VTRSCRCLCAFFVRRFTDNVINFFMSIILEFICSYKIYFASKNQEFSQSVICISSQVYNRKANLDLTLTLSAKRRYLVKPSVFKYSSSNSAQVEHFNAILFKTPFHQSPVPFNTSFIVRATLAQLNSLVRRSVISLQLSISYFIFFILYISAFSPVNFFTININ
jgi:hypothetical protein